MFSCYNIQSVTSRCVRSALTRSAPCIQKIFGNATLRRLEVEEVSTIHVCEHRRDDRSAWREDDSDIIAEEGRPIASLMGDASPKSNALRQPGRVELLAQNAKHVLRRCWAREL